MVQLEYFNSIYRTELIALLSEVNYLLINCRIKFCHLVALNAIIEAIYFKLERLSIKCFGSKVLKNSKSKVSHFGLWNIMYNFVV